MALNASFSRPFPEQLAFFQAKLNLPSQRWDDITHAAHDRAFIVAGAAEADLLQDLRDAVGAAIGGESIQDFRARFADIVQQHGWHGWTGEGSAAGEAWRTRVIYQTNLATSYAAGRWAQLTDPAFLKIRPYWRYVHADGVMHPRPMHLAWGEMQLTLRYDDPFWQTHFPPNGWGCHCYIVAVRAPAPDAATSPPEGWNIPDPKTGELPGIDKGFGYAPGAHASTPLADLVEQKLFNLDADLGAAMWARLEPAIAAERAQAWSNFLAGVQADPVKRGRLQVAGALTPDVLGWLSGKSVTPATAEIAVDDALIVGQKAQRHLVKGDALTPAEWAALPTLLDAPDQVLYDTRSGHLIFVGKSNDTRSAKIAVELDYQRKRAKGQTNLIVSAFKVPSVAIDGEIKGGFFEVVGKPGG